MVKLLKVVVVPDAVIAEAAALMVMVPPDGAKLAELPTVNTPATLKLLEVDTVAEAAIDKAWKVAVPLLEIDDPLFMVIVPALGVKVPDTVKADATVAVCVPVLILPLTVKLL